MIGGILRLGRWQRPSKKKQVHSCLKDRNALYKGCWSFLALPKLCWPAAFTSSRLLLTLPCARAMAAPQFVPHEHKPWEGRWWLEVCHLDARFQWCCHAVGGKLHRLHCSGPNDRAAQVVANTAVCEEILGGKAAVQPQHGARHGRLGVQQVFYWQWVQGQWQRHGWQGRVWKAWHRQGFPAKNAAFSKKPWTKAKEC